MPSQQRQHEHPIKAEQRGDEQQHQQQHKQQLLLQPLNGAQQPVILNAGINPNDGHSKDYPHPAPWPPMAAPLSLQPNALLHAVLGATEPVEPPSTAAAASAAKAAAEVAAEAAEVLAMGGCAVVSALPPAPGPALLVPTQASAGGSAGAAAVATPAAASPPPPLSANAASGSGGAATAAVEPSVTAPGASGGGGGAAPAQPLSDALKALDLKEILLSPASGETALAEAATAVYQEVERAADALGLPGELLDAVCGAVEAATEGSLACHRFLGMGYRTLRRHCLRGEVAAARAWMERMALRNGAS